MKPKAYWATLLVNARAGLLAIRRGLIRYNPALVRLLLGEAALSKRILRRGYHHG
jgi:hypothetical protein